MGISLITLLEAAALALGASPEGDGVPVVMHRYYPYEYLQNAQNPFQYNRSGESPCVASAAGDCRSPQERQLYKFKDVFKYSTFAALPRFITPPVLYSCTIAR